MAIEISVGLSDPPQVVVSGATPADVPDPLRRLLRETLARTGLDVGGLNLDVVKPNGTYPAKYVRGENLLDVGPKR